MANQKYLIVIAGPTSSGKTGVAIKIARNFNTEIISADSRQFFKEMNIGTAKPTAKEMAQVPHHFVDWISVQNGFSVGDFEKAALTLLEKLFKNHDSVVLTGGSGLYIRALLEGLDYFPEIPPAVRTQLNSDFEKNGIERLQNQLKSLDPEYYNIVDTNNPQRLIRALEVCIASGSAYSSFRKKQKVKRPFEIIPIKLEWERSELYDRINQKVDQMLNDGLVKEAQNLHHLKHLNALQTVGYQELFDYFENKIPLEEAIRLIKRNSRRYAKRQLTWLRKDDFWKAFHPGQVDEMIDYINELIHKK